VHTIKIHQIQIWPTYSEKKSSSMSYHPSANNVICEELHSRPSRKEWTRPLRVILGAQFLLQIRPITQLRVHYIHTTVKHFYYTLHCAVTPPLKKLPQWKNHPPAHPTNHPKRYNWHTYTELLLLLLMYNKLAKTYRISMWTSMHELNLTSRKKAQLGG